MICGSMAFSEKMLQAKAQLESLGHEVMVSSFVQNHVGKTQAESEALVLHEKMNDDAMRVDFEKLKNVDAILVLNYDKRGVANYIGGNTLLEMGFAHILHRKIFLLNPIPEIPYYKSEIEAMHPVILDGLFPQLHVGKEFSA